VIVLHKNATNAIPTILQSNVVIAMNIFAMIVATNVIFAIVIFVLIAMNYNTFHPPEKKMIILMILTGCFVFGV
tara:strand:+ start:2420 stop:2641 length:222 start_codon:yes stop_codon:yes gene_type:complete